MALIYKLIRKIKALNIKRIERYRSRKKPMPTGDGFIYRGPSTQFSDTWEQNERTFLRKIFERYDIFLNVGAHYGYYCCMARKAGLEVIAIEPLIANFKTLLNNLLLNDLHSECTLINAAAGQRPHISFIGGAFSTASMLNSHQHDKLLTQAVPIITIDTLAVDPKHDLLILMDVEGFEYEALLGASNLLKRSSRVDWIIEVFPFIPTKNTKTQENKNFFKLFEVMFDNGYQAWLISEKLTIITRETIELEAKKNYLDRMHGNFFFSRKELLITTSS